MDERIILSELNQRKNVLEGELSTIKWKLRGRLSVSERSGLQARRQECIAEIVRIGVAATQVRDNMRLHAEIKSDASETPAHSGACLLVVLWDGQYCYYAIRENVQDWLCEMIVELGQDAPVVINRTNIPVQFIDKLPAWIWLNPDERNGVDTQIPDNTDEFNNP